MSKAILSWDLKDPDELIDFNRCLKAKDMASVLWEFMRNTRKEIEWKIETDARLDKFDAIDIIYDKMNALLDIDNINIDEIIY